MKSKTARMDLARTDTYINVYLPRMDGVDPRRYTTTSSPLFNSDSIYKFSDQIVKDRKLFIDKKQMSLYEIYYKDSKGNGQRVFREGSKGEFEPRDSKDSENDGEGLMLHRRNELQTYQNNALPRVNNVRLALDRQLRRAKRTPITRFNESASSDGPIRYQHVETSRDVDSQMTSFEITTRKSGRLVTKGAARTRAISKLFKKAQSAPSTCTDLRQIRVLGLPPVNRSSNSANVSGEFNDVFKAQASQGRSLPLRPSSKPNQIWRQSTNVFLSEFSMLSDLVSTGKRLNTGSSRRTANTIGDNSFSLEHNS